METAVCPRLGIEIPILQAPMAGAVGPELVAAVSNAGGLGMLPVWHLEEEAVHREIRETLALTKKPFAVNLNMDFPQERHLEACLEEDIQIISFFWRDPSSLVPRAKDAGAVVMHTVGSAEDARRAVDCGVDIVVAQGWEAGGHVCGTVSTMALVPAVKDAVGDVPVIAAGGIADGRGMAAALSLGASAVWIGTRFLASEEAAIHVEYQQRLLASSEAGTVYLDNLFDVDWPDAPHRVLRNSTVEIWEAAGRPAPGNRPGEGTIVATSPAWGKIVNYCSYVPTPDDAGDIEALSLWAGQSVSMVRSVRPAAEIVHEINDDAAAILRTLGS